MNNLDKHITYNNEPVDRTDEFEKIKADILDDRVDMQRIISEQIMQEKDYIYEIVKAYKRGDTGWHFMTQIIESAVEQEANIQLHE